MYGAGNFHKCMVFPVVMCGCEGWNIKKAEHRRIDAFDLNASPAWYSIFGCRFFFTYPFKYIMPVKFMAHKLSQILAWQSEGSSLLCNLFYLFAFSILSLFFFFFSYFDYIVFWCRLFVLILFGNLCYLELDVFSQIRKFYNSISLNIFSFPFSLLLWKIML